MSEPTHWQIVESIMLLANRGKVSVQEAKYFLHQYFEVLERQLSTALIKE